MNLSILRADLEEFAEAISREEYLTRAGLKAESQAAAVREQFAVLGSRDAFEEVHDKAQDASGAEEARRLRYLAEFLGTTCVEYRARVLNDRLATAEALQTVEADGRQIPLRSVEARIKNEDDRARRAALEAARLSAVAEMNGLRREILETGHEEASRLGFPGYTALCRELSGIDLATLRDLTQPILSRSQDMYREVLAWYLTRWVGAPPREARRHDL
ncbi:MAG TPA: hypothetical protein VF431_00375, partial [Candidatus Methylomirabilis sp.]